VWKSNVVVVVVVAVVAAAAAAADAEYFRNHKLLVLPT
jgi:preprotein translocase subunit SecE